MYNAERMHLAAPAGGAMREVFAAAVAANALLVILHVSAIAAVLQQKLAVAQAAPELRRVGIRRRQRLFHGFFE
jgi:cytochrome b